MPGYERDIKQIFDNGMMARMDLIKELQRKTQDTSCSITDLMTTTLIIAEKIENHELRDWITKEVYGYQQNSDVPDYRKVGTRFEELTPDGWRACNVELLLNETNRALLANLPLKEPIFQIESSYNSANERGDECLAYNLPPQFHLLISQHNQYLNIFQYPIELHVYLDQYKSVLDSVRAMIAQWSAKLEYQGHILEDELSVESTEKVQSTINNLYVDTLLSG